MGCLALFGCTGTVARLGRISPENPFGSTACDNSVSLQYATEPCRQERRAAFVGALRANLPAGSIDAQHQKTINAILDGRLLIGMSKDEAEASWGVPYPINKTTTAAGEREQWVYSGYGLHGSYAYFLNGKLTGWQERP